MSRKKTQRLIMISLTVLFIGSGLSIILTIFNENIIFFYSPTDIKEKTIKQNSFIRVGGLVKKGSIKVTKDMAITFYLTDYQNDIQVQHKGILPPMFREGQGIVAEGKLKGDIFYTKRLLTKHDEQYMPPEVAESLKKSGYWKPENNGVNK